MLAGQLGIGTSIVTRAGPTLSLSAVTWSVIPVLGHGLLPSSQALSLDASATPGTSASLGIPVYNFTVADDHTYFVGTTGGGAWVHNTSTRAVNAVLSSQAMHPLEARAVQLHLLLKDASGFRTTAVVEAIGPDGSVVRFVASSEPRLSKAQRGALLPGEIEVAGRGHAETTAIDYALSQGYEPTMMKAAASRGICAPCMLRMFNLGVKPVSPLRH